MIGSERDWDVFNEDQKKENCLQHLRKMCYETGAKVIDIQPEYGRTVR